MSVMYDMRRQISSILNYYKPMALWSFLVTLAITIIHPELVLAICTKFFLVLLLYIMLKDRSLRKRLQFYRISGVSNLKFFGIIFILDSVFTCSFIAIIKGFI